MSDIFGRCETSHGLRRFLCFWQLALAQVVQGSTFWRFEAPKRQQPCLQASLFDNDGESNKAVPKCRCNRRREGNRMFARPLERNHNCNTKAELFHPFICTTQSILGSTACMASHLCRQTRLSSKIFAETSARTYNITAAFLGQRSVPKLFNKIASDDVRVREFGNAYQDEFTTIREKYQSPKNVLPRQKAVKVMQSLIY